MTNLNCETVNSIYNNTSAKHLVLGTCKQYDSDEVKELAQAISDVSDNLTHRESFEQCAKIIHSILRYTASDEEWNAFEETMDMAWRLM